MRKNDINNKRIKKHGPLKKSRRSLSNLQKQQNDGGAQETHNDKNQSQLKNINNTRRTLGKVYKGYGTRLLQQSSENLESI